VIRRGFELYQPAVRSFEKPNVGFLEVLMFCPQCGHRQASNEIRFCSSCGLPLGLVTDLVGNSGDQLKREKRELTGISFMIATVLMLTNFIIVFGSVTLPHLANPVFLWIWLSFVIASLIVGGFGLANLIRGGFFKRLKERESRLYQMKERQKLAEGVTTAGLDVEAMPRFAEPVSVTETTTRELGTISKKAGEAARTKEPIINK
jgi:hypothetical protein